MGNFIFGRVVCCNKVFVCLWLGKDVDFFKSVLVCWSKRFGGWVELDCSLGLRVWVVFFMVFFIFLLVCKFRWFCFFCWGKVLGFLDLWLFSGGKFFFMNIFWGWVVIEIEDDLMVVVVVFWFCNVVFMLFLLFFEVMLFVLELFLFLCYFFFSLFKGVEIELIVFFICFFLFLYVCVNWLFLY